MRGGHHMQRLRRAQRPLAAGLLAFFLVQLPFTALATGRHVAEMALAALYGDSVCRPGATGNEPAGPKAPSGLCDCCLAGCTNPSVSTATLPAEIATVLPRPELTAGRIILWRTIAPAPARFASDISSRGPPARAA
jgi:hypothetical protein